MMKTTWLFPALALLAGSAGGFFIGKGSGSSSLQPASISQPSGRSPESKSTPANRDSGGKRPKSVDQIMGRSDQVSRTQALLDYYQRLALSRFTAEAEKLKQLPLGERTMAAGFLFARWAESDPEAALAYSDKMDGLSATLKGSVLQNWAGADPEAAVRYLADHARELAGLGGHEGGGAKYLIALEWAKTDPEAALAWANTLKGSGQNKEALESLISELSARDPRKAVEMAGAFESADRSAAYQWIASRWGAKDFGKAEAWIKTLPADQHGAALASALNSLAVADPVEAASKIAGLPDGESKRNSTVELVYAWSLQDPEKAAAWLGSQTHAASELENLRGQLIRNWATQDDAGARSYVDSLPPGGERDAVAKVYIRTNRSSDRKAIMDLAESLTEGPSRQSAIVTAGMHWLSEDPEAAAAHISSLSTLSDEVKQRLVKGQVKADDF